MGIVFSSVITRERRDGFANERCHPICVLYIKFTTLALQAGTGLESGTNAPGGARVMVMLRAVTA